MLHETLPTVDYYGRERSHRHAGAMSLVRSTYAVVLAGGRGARLEHLTSQRAKPAVPFAGKFCIIDFALSNCVNSGIRRIGVLTQYKAQSLIRHIEHGWDFLETSLGEFVDIVPAQQQLDEGWYSGTANAVFQNIRLLHETQSDLVLILAGDHVYKMDYSLMLQEHAASGADITVAVIEVGLEDARRMGVVVTDAEDRITGFEEKPEQPCTVPGRNGTALASMGIYVFGRQFLVDQLTRDAADSSSGHDFGRNMLPRLTRDYRVVAHRFERSCVNMVGARPYWRDVGTVDAFWEANIDLVQVVPELNLYDDQWPILSLQRQLPPAKFVLDQEGRRGMALNSLVSSGCIVSGAVVRRSILFSKVRVAEGSVVEDSVILPNAVLGRDVHLQRAVVDMHCVLPDGLCAGLDPAQDRRRFHVTDRGVTLITPEMLGQSSAPGPD